MQLKHLPRSQTLTPLQACHIGNLIYFCFAALNQGKFSGLPILIIYSWQLPLQLAQTPGCAS
jgi:hypothetical protein